MNRKRTNLIVLSVIVAALAALVFASFQSWVSVRKAFGKLNATDIPMLDHASKVSLEISQARTELFRYLNKFEPSPYLIRKQLKKTQDNMLWIRRQQLPQSSKDLVEALLIHTDQFKKTLNLLESNMKKGDAIHALLTANRLKGSGTTLSSLSGKLKDNLWDYIIYENEASQKRILYNNALLSGISIILILMLFCGVLFQNSVLKRQVQARTFELEARLDDLHQSKRALQESEAKFKELADMLPQTVFETDTEARLIYTNQFGFQSFGYTEEDFQIGLKTLDMLIPEHRDRAYSNIRRIMAGENNLEEEYIALRANGTTFPVIIYSNRIQHSGETLGLRGIIVDITERKRAEMALIDSERKWRNILINTPQIGIALDPQAKITFANAHFLKLTGWKEQEIIGQDWFDLFIPEDVREEVRGVFNAVMGQKDALGFSNYENEIMIKSGELRNVGWSNVLTRDTQGNIVDVTCLGIDLTEIRRAEEDLRQSEERQRSILQTAMDGFWLTDHQGLLLEVNETYCRMSGYSKEELLSMSISDLEASETPEDVAAHANRIIKMGQDRFESWHRRKDGTLFEVEVSAQHRLLEGGRFVCFIRDITKRKEAERALRKSDERLKLALDSVTDAVWDWRVDTGEVYFSSRWYTMLGYEPYELPQEFETWRQLLHPDDLQKSEKTVFHHLELAEPFEIEFRMRTKDGQWRWILARGKTVEKDKNGKAARMLGTHVDSTDRKKMEGQIQQAQKMESVGNLAGGIAHDFNNILFPIVGMSELLLQDLPPGSSEHLSVQEILKAGKRGRDLVKQILALSRQSEHKMIPVRVQQILKEVLKLTRSTIPADIEIIQNIQTDCGFVMADATQLHQIAMNLITNAYHAVETTGGNVSIKLLEAEYDGENLPSAYLDPGRYVVLSISDTGSGIDPAIMDKIFEPYFTTKEQGKGTGLGLSVVYGLVKEHGGGIKVDSEIGKGTTFKVYLPLIAEQVEQAPAEKLDIDPTGTERILLVDDEEAIVRVLKQVLERLGYHVVERTSSPDALKAFIENPSAFDLVISDMTMPNMTGDRLARELIAIRPDIPIIICTGFSERIDKEKASAVGIKGFIMKPIIQSEMANMVRKILDEAKGKTQQ
jgi:PAS domain S-box-containing protein